MRTLSQVPLKTLKLAWLLKRKGERFLIKRLQGECQNKDGARARGRGLWWATRPDPEPEVIPNSPSPSREAAGKQAGQGEVLSDQAGGRAGAMIKALRERERTKSCTSQQQQANATLAPLGKEAAGPRSLTMHDQREILGLDLATSLQASMGPTTY